MKEILQLINTYLLCRYFHHEDTSEITKAFPIFLRSTVTLAKKHGYEQIIEVIKYVLANKNKHNAMFMPGDAQILQHMESANAYTLQLTR